MSRVIQVFSDYSCPFCYIGEETLSRAVRVAGGEIVRRAWLLRVDGPPRLDPVGEAMNEGWRNTIYPMAERLGVEIRQPSRAPLTRMAHEAAAWARTQGRLEEFHRGLFKLLFVEDRDIGDVEVLKELAWKIGLNSSVLAGVLEGGEMADEVDEDLLIARTYGIKGVPTYVIGGHLIYGVQEDQALIRAIETAREGRFNGEMQKLPNLPINITKAKLHS
jgi:predicted DsbA family dithiol-disulfide isomerase